jgi:hypothetical protein
MTNTKFSRSQIQETPSYTHSRNHVWDGVLDVYLPHKWGRWIEHSLFVLETEGAWCVYSPPSVIRQDRADDTSPINGGGKKVFEIRPETRADA